MNLTTLRRLLRYDSKTGNLLWRDYRNREGKVAGGLLDNGYVKIQIKGGQYLAHRLVWFYHNGYFPENFIDHIDRDKANNRIGNLREVSNQCNQRNSKIGAKNTSGVKGVTFDKGYWLARITINKKVTHVGCSKDFTEAVAYRLAAEQSLNWDGCDSSSSSYLYMKEYLCRLG